MYDYDDAAAPAADDYEEDAGTAASTGTGYGFNDPYQLDRHGSHSHYQPTRQSQGITVIPEVIRNFLTYFQQVIADRNVTQIQECYENGFPKLTERFFKNDPWPDTEVITKVVGQQDPFFLILYKELYFRHIYARVAHAPTFEHRYESYYNYCNLFNFILNNDGPINRELPNQWLWDIIDEFIYQFQSFSLFRSNLAKLETNDISHIRSHPTIWNVHSVLNVLHSLVEKSHINSQLEVFAAGGEPETVAGEFGMHSLYKMLGYFSLIGLCRLHSLLGDFYQAIHILENIDINKKTMYSRVPACQVTTYYFVGFAYLMMRRYQDAIRTFVNILLYIQRTKQIFQHKNFQVELINKQHDQMYALLAIALTLHPTRIDESVHSQLKEKFGEKMPKMAKGEMTEFEEAFRFACPKFLSPVPPNYDVPTVPSGNTGKEPYLQQLNVFKDEVEQQIWLPTIRSYLKLYTTMPISKLAAFMEIEERVLKTHLLAFKHKMKNVVWTKGSGSSGLEGELQSSSEVDFYIDKDMIHIADTKVARRYGDFFIRQILKFEEINRSLVSAGK